MGKAQKTNPQVGTAYIEQMQGADKGKLYDLSMDIMSIGRAPDNDIIFPSESVSRCHAFLKRTGSGWMLQDNQSKNGVKKNGDKVVETALRHGDVVQIGEFVFMFVDPIMSNSDPVTSPIRISPRPAPKASGGTYSGVQAAPAPTAVDEAFEALQPKTNWAQIQFGAGIVAVVVISVLIGFKLRSVLSHRVDAKHVEPVIAPTVEMPVLVAAQKTLAPKSTVALEPIDQNNPNEGRVVSEEVIDAHASATLDPRLVEKASPFDAAPPVAIDTPPPPPIADGLSKKDLQIQTRKARSRNITKDLGVYLQEGRDYLKEGDFESAALAFRFALVIEPNNRTAIEGIRAAEYRRKEMPGAELEKAHPVGSTSNPISTEIPLPPGDRKGQVRTLLNTAKNALAKRSYQEAINNAERARRVEIRGETAYLNEAKQIIDHAKLKQKDDFDPFIARAKEKLKAGDYQGSRMLCEEMLRTDPAYSEARECVAQANEGLKGKKGQ